MATAPLCTVAQVKAWANIPSSDANNDATIGNILIPAYSMVIQNYCGRPFLSQSYTENRRGTNQRQILLWRWPVTAIATVTVGTTVIPAATNPTVAGYFNVDSSTYPGDGRVLLLNSYQFDSGYPQLSGSMNANVQIVYTAGWANGVVTGELWNIPGAPGPYTITLAQAFSYVGGDAIVYTIGGTPFVKVSGNPAVGQYSITATGVVTFNPGDAGAAVTIGYNVIGYPADLTQCAIELCALRLKSTSWIGKTSQSLAGETTAYETKFLPDRIKQMLQPYKIVSVTP